MRRFIREDVEKGMEYFRQALALDPNYAPAHAGLAYGYIFGLGDWYLPNKEVFPKGKEAAGRALAIDGSLAEAHAFLAMARFIHDYDWAGAEQEFRRAIDGNPGSPDAHRWYGAYLGTQGRMEAGLQEIKRALELDPLSAEGNHLLGLQLYVARRYDEAIEQLPRVLELDPNYYWAQMVLGQAYEQRRQFAEATAAFQRARQLTGDEGPPEILAGLARSRALAGDRVAAMKFLGELKALMNRRYVSRHDVATVYVALNETQQALDWLEKAYEDRNWWMPWLRVDPRVASLRSERRFQAIVDRMAFPTIGSRDK
jgi:tetratricopeptide (TPR) repeat protein